MFSTFRSLTRGFWPSHPVKVVTRITLLNSPASKVLSRISECLICLWYVNNFKEISIIDEGWPSRQGDHMTHFQVYFIYKHGLKPWTLRSKDQCAIDWEIQPTRSRLVCSRHCSLHFQQFCTHTFPAYFPDQMDRPLWTRQRHPHRLSAIYHCMLS